MIFVFNNSKINFKNPVLLSLADSSNKNSTNVMRNIWSNKKFLKQKYNYLNNLNKKIISQLANEYKKNFKLNYSLDFWKIIFTPWISYFTFTIFDNYYNFEKAKLNKKVKEFYLAKNKIYDYIPEDYTQFAHLLKNDDYRFFLFSNVAMLSSRKKQKNKYTKLKLKNSKNIYLNGKFRDNNSIKQMTIFFSKIFLNRKDKKSLILDLPVNPIFKNSNYFKFIKKFLFIPFKYKNYGKNNNYNLRLRGKLKLNLNNNYFEKILSKIIKYQIPCSILENLFKNIEFIKKKYPKNQKKISSSISFWDDDLVKIWIALSIENKTKFFPRQHGGSYGTDLIHINEHLEKNIGHKFISWGWKDKKVKALPSIEQNLNFRKKEINLDSNFSLNSKDILMIVSPANRYSKNIYSSPMGDEWYFHNKKILNFSKNYSKIFKGNLVVRTLDYFESWNLTANLKSISPKIKVVSRGKIQEQIKDFSLIIGTNPSTTMYDILISGKPCIFFWENKLWPSRPKAKKYFELLRKEKILFFDEKAAIKHLKTINKSKSDWWGDKKRQKAIQNFLNNFCVIKRDYLKIWNNFLN
tara:strand:+ start:44 stop:1777 length:1734 start_codon:yes stop_codon:yes gene_type:complete